MQTITKLVKRGPYSYAIPISKSTLEELKIDPANDEILVDLKINDFEHKLTIQSKKEHDYNESHSYLSQMFDQFFDKHPEIKDRDAYLKDVYQEQLDRNQKYEQLKIEINKTFKKALTDRLKDYLDQQVDDDGESTIFDMTELLDQIDLKLEDKTVLDQYKDWLIEFDSDNVNHLTVLQLINLINNRYQDQYQANEDNTNQVAVRTINY